MKKCDLRLGQILKTKSGEVLINAGDKWVGTNVSLYQNYYTEQFKNILASEHDIETIYDVKSNTLENFGFGKFNTQSLKVIWECSHLTDNTKTLLSMLVYDWIAKDKDDIVYCYKEKPTKGKFDWTSDSDFKIINLKSYKDVNLDSLSWDNDESTYIPDLLKEI